MNSREIIRMKGTDSFVIRDYIYMTPIKIPTTPQVRRLNAIVEHVDFITDGKLDCFEALDVARWLANHDQPFLAGCLFQAIENAHNPVDNTPTGD